MGESTDLGEKLRSSVELKSAGFLASSANNVSNQLSWGYIGLLYWMIHPVVRDRFVKEWPQKQQRDKIMTT
jgi:hypothetical protein